MIAGSPGHRVLLDERVELNVITHRAHTASAPIASSLTRARADCPGDAAIDPPQQLKSSNIEVHADKLA